MLTETVLAYIDILGYRQLVKKIIGDPSLVDGIEKLIKKSTLGMWEKYRDIPGKNNYSKDNAKRFRDILDAIHFRVVSDSIIITLMIGRQEPDVLESYLQVFLQSVTAVCRMFIAKTGYLVRGCVAKGLHYENTADPQFLFFVSPVLIDAYSAAEEKNENFPPAVAAHPKLLEWLHENVGVATRRKYFYEEGDFSCLDLYAGMEKDDFLKDLLSDISKGLALNFEENRNDPRIAKKLCQFAKYHNQKAIDFGLPGLCVNIETHGTRCLPG